jgi:hypothetical protein
MSIISGSELAEIREAIETDLLPDTCSILSVTEVNNGMGGVTETWGTASANVACRLDMKTGVDAGRERVIGGAIQPYTMYMMSLPYDVTIASTNRILHSAITYAVVSINRNQSWIGVTRVELEVV